jgi:transcriptional regulator with GAF, ATPase, and Fis domain
MAASASWAIVPAINATVSFEVEDANPAKIELDRLPCIVGHSAALGPVRGMVRVVAPTDATVLINGETGAGKELIAEAIHKWSDRSPAGEISNCHLPTGTRRAQHF